MNIKQIIIILLVFFLGFGISYANNNHLSRSKVVTFINTFETSVKSNHVRIIKLNKIKNKLLKFGNKNKNIYIFIEILDLKIKQYKRNIEVMNFKRIAHAGGEYNGKSYTNSIDAIEKNKKYFSLFEIDFSWTSDNKLVCLHDWGGSFYNNFGFSVNGNIPNYKLFNSYVNNNQKYKNCVLESLINWLDNNPDKYIITDIKNNNTLGLKYISENYPDYINRFIPQIYDPINYKYVKELGYNKVIWTLYKYGGNTYDILYYARKMNLYAITMPISRVNDGLGLKINGLNIFTYTHTINSYDELNKIRKLGIDEIYTDKLKK